jgi:uncharacterized protein
MTDLLSKLIIENTLVPAFRQGDFSGGIERAVDDIVAVLSGDTAELEARARRNQEEENLPLPVVLFILIWVILFFGGMAMALLAPIFGRKIGPGRYRWLGTTVTVGGPGSGGWSSGISSGGWSSGSSGGFSGGGGSSGGGGASGSW